ncbi:DUF4352 domain-containing protein [Mycobacterium angelicum]|uniref:DUF4352 domain-containing protein n=1 Tax=Mycobacterium angelicum TaxID=470074 RepID=UPI0009F533B6|nr:DUF4352 domain-containing protein [Mycobacterium angelicum]MCV7196951.1 DUF4352 domain-containing protein [Mycobacterium angelicum]
MRITPASALVAVAIVVSGCLSWVHSSAPTASLNDEVRDGNFAFTVTVIDLGVQKIGYQAPQGVFVVVHLMVKNIGKLPRTVYCQNQTLRDQAGRKYDNALTVGSREDQININPGSQVHVRCAFDVPVGTLPATLQVRDSPYSKGAIVTLLGAH